LVIDDIMTVSLPDLLNLKLRSGMSKLTRAQDLADVIGLIEDRKLAGGFAAKLYQSLRAEFRKLVSAVKRQA
jgi:hypothetical protein